jgi:hypothetical protein
LAGSGSAGVGGAVGRRARTWLALAAALTVAVGAAGCGDDDPSSATVVQQPTTAVAPATGPDATIPTTTTPTVTSPSTSTTTTTTPTATTGVPLGGGAPDDTGGTPAGGEQGEGGAGDEEATRVPVALTADGGALSPTVVTIPAFLAIELAVTARGGAERLTIGAPGGGSLAVAAGATARKRLAGLRPGDYAVATAGGGRTTLHVVSGGDPGP